VAGALNLAEIGSFFDLWGWRRCADCNAAHRATWRRAFRFKAR
jgi:hypothetical protein